MRANQVFVRTVEPSHERRGQALLPGADEHRLGAHGAAAAAVRSGRAAGGARLVQEQRDALAVDRHVDVLEPRVGAGVQRDLEDVFRVGRKHVVHDDAPARAVRGAVDVIPRMLRDVAGGRVRVVDGWRVAVAHGHAADRGGGIQVRLEQRGRQRLRVRDVVEVRALGVERQPAAGVHVEREQIAHAARVLGPVETLEGASARIGVR